MSRLHMGGVALVVVTLGIVVLLTAEHRTSLSKESGQRVAAVDAGPRVQLVSVEAGGGNRNLVLTGESRPFLAVTLYSKVSGYLTDVRVDKGDRVHKGQVLAVVESPETDAAFASAEADAKNKRIIADRDAQLINRKLIAPEEAETAESDAAQAEAHAKALETLKGYEVLKAPFDGVITARYADPGALMQNAQTSQTSALPVVAVGQIDSLRVFVYVDQANAGDVRRGSPVILDDPSRPGQPIHTRVSRYTGELDPETRTLLAEIDVPNPKHDLVAGSIVQATLEVHSAPYERVPAEAVFARGLENFVATVTADNRVAFRQVHVVDNDGQTVRLAPGDLHPGDRVALNLGDAVPDGQRVQPLGEPAA
ncbi:MAG TPA: efflux RND transporter periplasmic adaptor subunit [Gemmatimonadaceae bacterium]|nr:efflux RND transporter periplasmic adaptor subunit [Gemmatimonadaceae bacterium]